MQQDDREIIECYGNDRKRGIRMLFDRYYRPLVLYAGTLIHDDVMAEDIVQEFFVRLWNTDYLTGVSPQALSSYLFSSTKNSCYTYINKKDVLNVSVDIAGVDFAADAAIGMNQQIVDRVMKVITCFPEQTRKVMEQVLIQDKEYKEAAAELNVSVNTVKTLLRNGMRILRKELKDPDTLFLFLLFKRKASFFSFL